MNQPDVQLLTPGEVADRLRVSEESVRGMRRSGQLRGLKVRGKWRYRLADVQAYLARCEVSAALP